MRENELIKALRLEIINQLTLEGIKNFEVVRDHQPTTQSAGGSKNSKNKTEIFIHQISHKVINQVAYGINGNFTHNFQARVQIRVAHYFNYKDPNAMTPDDICELISNVLFERDTIANLRKVGVRMQRRYGISPGFFINEEQLFENLPSFDFIVTYQTNRNKKIQTVNSMTGSLNEI